MKLIELEMNMSKKKDFSKEDLALAKLGFCYNMEIVRKGIGVTERNPQPEQRRLRFCISDYHDHVEYGHCKPHPDIRTREQYRDSELLPA